MIQTFIKSSLINVIVVSDLHFFAIYFAAADAAVFAVFVVIIICFYRFFCTHTLTGTVESRANGVLNLTMN